MAPRNVPVRCRRYHATLAGLQPFTAHVYAFGGQFKSLLALSPDEYRVRGQLDERLAAHNTALVRAAMRGARPWTYVEVGKCIVAFLDDAISSSGQRLVTTFARV